MSMDAALIRLNQRLNLLEEAADRRGVIDVPTRTFPCARVHRTTVQNIANASFVAVAFDAESFDTEAIHSTATNTSRLTAVTAGYYWIKGTLLFDPANTAGSSRAAYLRINGATLIDVAFSAPLGLAGVTLSPSGLWPMSAGDYVELIAVQDSGVGLNIQANSPQYPALMMTRLGTF